ISIFFFQAEDGIRDFHVTGVQTCALPISHRAEGDRRGLQADRAGERLRSKRGATVSSTMADSSSPAPISSLTVGTGWFQNACSRSEERRVGKEGRSGWSR